MGCSNLPEHRRGDTWFGMRVYIPPFGATPWTGVVAKVDWRSERSITAQIATSWSSTGSTPLVQLTVLDAPVPRPGQEAIPAGYLDLHVHPHIPALPVGLWHSDIQLTWPELPDILGEPLTYTPVALSWLIITDGSV